MAGLSADAPQEAVLPELGTGIRSACMARRKKRVFFKRAPEPPQGLYLWGGVGRGKSDGSWILFAANSAMCLRGAVHFIAFMQEIHNAMHEAGTVG